MLVVIGLDAYSIVPDVKNRFIILPTILTDFDARIRLITHEFGRIIKKILQNLCQALTIYTNGGQVRLDVDRDSSCFDLPMNQLPCGLRSEEHTSELQSQ